MEKTASEPPKKENGSYFTSFLNRIGGVFLAPDSTFNQIITDRIGFWEPLTLMILLLAIQGTVAASFAYRVLAGIANAISPFGDGFSLNIGSLVSALILVTIIVTLLLWVVVAGIAHLCAKYIFRGEGSYVQLLKLYAYSLIPYSLVILSTVIFGLSWAVWPISVFLNTIAVFWIVLLMALAVKQNYKIDTGKAFISSFVGPMVFWLIITGIFWAWIWLVINSFSGGFT